MKPIEKVSDLSIWDSIKWTATDTEGEYNHQGNIVGLDERHVTFQTQHGVMSVEFVAGTIEKVKAIKFEGEEHPPRLAVSTTRAPIPIAAKAKRDPKTGTKLDRAFELYQGLTDKSRKNAIKTFTEQLGMTPAGASTYQAICKKKFG